MNSVYDTLVEPRNETAEENERCIADYHRIAGLAIAAGKRWLAMPAALKFLRKRGYKDFRNVAMTDGSLRDMNWGGCDFSHAWLPGVSFHGADITHAKFIGANLTSGYLTSTRAQYSNFAYAHLDCVEFGDCAFHGVNFYGASLLSTQFVRVSYSEVEWLAQAGPVGLTNRIIYANLTPQGVRVQAGCFYGSPDAARAKIEIRYRGHLQKRSYLLAVDYLEAALLDIESTRTGEIPAALPETGIPSRDEVDLYPAVIQPKPRRSGRRKR